MMNEPSTRPKQLDVPKINTNEHFPNQIIGNKEFQRLLTAILFGFTGGLTTLEKVKNPDNSIDLKRVNLISNLIKSTKELSNSIEEIKKKDVSEKIKKNLIQEILHGSKRAAKSIQEAAVRYADTFSDPKGKDLMNAAGINIRQIPIFLGKTITENISTAEIKVRSQLVSKGLNFNNNSLAEIKERAIHSTYLQLINKLKSKENSDTGFNVSMQSFLSMLVNSLNKQQVSGIKEINQALKGQNVEYEQMIKSCLSVIIDQALKAKQTNHILNIDNQEGFLKTDPTTGQLEIRSLSKIEGGQKALYLFTSQILLNPFLLSNIISPAFGWILPAISDLIISVRLDKEARISLDATFLQLQKAGIFSKDNIKDGQLDPIIAQETLRYLQKLEQNTLDAIGKDLIHRVIHWLNFTIGFYNKYGNKITAIDNPHIVGGQSFINQIILNTINQNNSSDNTLPISQLTEKKALSPDQIITQKQQEVTKKLQEKKVPKVILVQVAKIFQSTITQYAKSYTKKEGQFENIGKEMSILRQKRDAGLISNSLFRGEVAAIFEKIATERQKQVDYNLKQLISDPELRIPVFINWAAIYISKALTGPILANLLPNLNPTSKQANYKNPVDNILTALQEINNPPPAPNVSTARTVANAGSSDISYTDLANEFSNSTYAIPTEVPPEEEN
jgi:hypothetical protein